MTENSGGRGRHDDALLITARREPSDLYRAIWRWHFYAGLLILPFLVTLALSGAIYLFKDEVDGIVHARFIRVAPSDTRLPPSQLIAAAEQAQPGKVVKITEPPSDDRSTEITIQPGTGGPMAVFVDQHDGRVLEVRPDRSTFAWTVRYLHSLRFFGATPRMWIEIVAGWAIILVLTGTYLWWPRARAAGGVVTVRGTPARRVFWRDLHAVTGLGVGGFVLFLALTGLPWSSVWGAKVHSWANGTNFGYPAGLFVDVPMSAEHLDHVAKTSWTLEQAQIPMTHAPHAGMAPVGIDAAVAAFRALGLHPGFSVALPDGPTGVYSGSVYPDDIAAQRVIHLDQYSARPLVDVSFADYGPVAKAIEWGVNTHLGQTFGAANQIVLLLACAGIVLLAVSAAVMWWKRRPARALGVPPLPSDRRVFAGLFVLLGIGGVLFPLTGLSMVVMIALDLIGQRVAALARPARTA